MKVKLLIILSVLLILIGVVSCGKRISKTYIDSQKEILFAYNNEDFARALQYADAFLKETEKSFPQDFYIALLERAKIAFDHGTFDTAIKDFQIAEKRFLNIEGTISLSEETSGVFLDDTTKEYEAEPLEKLMISPYLVLSYWLKGDFNGARVERQRTIGKISQYIESQGEEALYLENPFARYLSAIVFENESKWDNARIEYNKIAKTFTYLKDKMNAEIERVKKTPPLNDLVIFIDLGKTPMKFEKRQGPYKSGNIEFHVVYPEYKPRDYTVRKVKVLIDGKEMGEAELLYNMAYTVLEQYKKNEPKVLKALITRVGAKVLAQAAGNEVAKQGGVIGLIGTAASAASKVSSALERADLRGWISLPAEVHFYRAFNVTPGEHTVQLVYLNAAGIPVGQSPVKKVIVPEGKIGVTHFRVVR